MSNQEESLTDGQRSIVRGAEGGTIGSESVLYDENIMSMVVTYFDSISEASHHLKEPIPNIWRSLSMLNIDYDWERSMGKNDDRGYQGEITSWKEVKTEKRDPDFKRDPHLDVPNDEIEEYDGEMGLYVLRCEEDNYYVGATNDLKRRLRQHFTDCGSLWTKRYSPKEIVNIETLSCSYDEMLEKEDQLTLDMMEKRGWKNVRGGKWWSPFLSYQP